jgi:hypothetical protein
MKDWRRVGKITLMAIAVFFAGLYFYSTSEHAGTDSVEVEDLASYGMPGVGLHISYPKWITADDIGATNGVVIVTAVDGSYVQSGTLTVLFDCDPDTFMTVDEDGSLKDPILEIDVGRKQAFYLQPRDQKVLTTEAKSVIVTHLKTGTGVHTIPDLEFPVKLESPTWKMARDWSSGFTPVPLPSFLMATFSVGWFVVGRSRRP